MALIEIFHVVAAEKPVAAGETIKEGQIVSLDTAGDVVKQNSVENWPYGIAADTKSTSASSMPGIDSANGWQNRVSDYFDETKASGKMTVYHSGGEFATDQFAANVASAVVGDPLYAVNGNLDTVDSQSSGEVARVLSPAGSWPSGVPGTDINGDMKVSGENSSTYVQIKLMI
jgi:hypothetical protein